MSWRRAIAVVSGVLLCSIAAGCGSGSTSPRSSLRTPPASVEPGIIAILTAGASAPRPALTPGTPLADFARGVIAILTAGIPTGTDVNAPFVGAVLAAGGIKIDSMTAQTLSDDQLHEGIESLASGRSEGKGFTVSVYTTPEGSELAARTADSTHVIRCGRILLAFDGDGDAVRDLASRVLVVMQNRYGSCGN